MASKKAKKRLEAAVDALESFIEAARKAKLFREDHEEPVTETSPKLMRKLLIEPAPPKMAVGGFTGSGGGIIPAPLDNGYIIPKRYEQFDPAKHLWGIDAAWEDSDYPKPSMLIEHSPTAVNVTYLPIPKD